MTTNAAYPAEDLHLLNQVVSDPRFQRLGMPPTIAPAELAVLGGAYAVLALSTWAGISGWVPYLVSLLLSSLAMFAVFTPLHDAVHRSVSSHPGLNDLIGNAAALMLVPGITTRLYRYLHLEHHRYTGEPSRDPDEAFISAPWPLRLLTWMFIDIHWSLFYIKRWGERPVSERRAFIASIGFFLTWHVVWLFSPWAIEFLMYWLVPQRIGVTLVVYLFAYIQHPEGVEQHRNPLHATRMIRGGKPMRFLLLGQSQHLIHHLFPGVPFYRYNEAWGLGRSALSARESEIAWQWPFTRLTPPAIPPARNEVAALLVRVVDMRDIGEAVRMFELEGAGQPLPAFTPGAHIDVHLDQGVVRQYSLCGDPAIADRWRIAVKREDAGRGGSRAVHDRLRPGEVIRVSHPRNHFPLSETTARAVLVAGGIGVTPLLAMAYTLQRKGTPFELHLCARSRAALPFGHELQRFPFAGAIRTHLDDDPSGARFSVAALPVWRGGDTLYICGPAGFMDAVIGQARAHGWPDEQIATESFHATAPDPAQDRPFTAELRRSGRCVEVPAGRSLLEVLQASDIELVASCTQGLCGACVVTVLDGEVDHRDHMLGERQYPKGCLMTACVSRARGERIVLDL